MTDSRAKGYRVERKIGLLFGKHGWRVIRAGRSLGEADLLCLKNKECLLLQIKSTNKDKFYYYGLKDATIDGFPFYLIVDFGYGKVRILSPKGIVSKDEGEDLVSFLERIH